MSNFTFAEGVMLRDYITQSSKNRTVYIMRIISGTAKGRKIIVPKGVDVRPTTDRVREALFGHLGSKIENADILDLFGGSGSLGFEAISRSARHVLFVERSKKVAFNLKQNIETLGFKDKSTVIIADAISFLNRVKNNGHCYDLIFLDPPYRTELLNKTLKIISTSKIICSNTVIVAEYPSDLNPQILSPLKIIKTKKYGKTSITTIKWQKTDGE